MSQVDNGVVGSTNSQFEPWTFVEGSVVLGPGVYTFAVDMDNFLNFDQASLTAAGPHDSDCDGVPDILDLDSDNDGIFDAVEAGHDESNTGGRLDCPSGVGANGFCDDLETAPDSGVPDYDSDATGPDFLAQSEGDNVADMLDLDSDNDGISDLIEGNSGCADIAPLDGRCDGPVNDDGVALDAVGGPADVDGDLRPDYLDLDSDNDGISDLIEGASGCADTTPTNNVCDGPFTAVGVAADATESPPDTDGDGTLDFRDLDSNNDGTFDITQGGSGCADTSPADNVCDLPVDANGFPQSAGPLSCGNGTLEANEGCDDGNTVDDGNGCSATCLVTTGSACNALVAGAQDDSSCASGICDTTGNAAPGICEAANICGNGSLDGAEACDDGNTTSGDGCSSTCFIDNRANSATAASAVTRRAHLATATRRKLLTPASRQPAAATGSSTARRPATTATRLPATAALRPAFWTTLRIRAAALLAATPRARLATATRRKLLTPASRQPAAATGSSDGAEACDDGNTTSGDGCSSTCFIDTGQTPATAVLAVTRRAHLATATRRKLLTPASRQPAAATDDGAESGDGTLPTCFLDNLADTGSCAVGGDAACASGNCDTTETPDTCEPATGCGNGLVDGAETCDDGNTTSGDGCSATCFIDNRADTGDCSVGGDAACASGNCDTTETPDTCEPATGCGNGLVDGAETCDDGNTTSGDGCSSTCDTDVDTDSDGVFDIDDIDDDNDGILDVVEGLPTTDTDNDGVPDQLDLDSDGDGLLDIQEAGHGLDSGTGTVECASGFGANGFCDDLETSAESGVPDYDGDASGPDDPIDFDGDTVPDFQDIDSDNDGLVDLQEGGAGCTDTTPIDGRCDVADTDGDGVSEEIDDLAGFGDSSYLDPTDSNSNGTPDFHSLDSDGDSLFDAFEGTTSCADTAPEDGLCDSSAGATGLPADAVIVEAPDFDGDGVPDYQDVDSDNDGILDALEGADDADGDGQPNALDLDADGDGLPDVVEGNSGCADAAAQDGQCDGPFAADGLATDATNLNPPDTDGDTAPDFLDLDSDNDGALDWLEAGEFCADAAPANGICDADDADGDGLADDIVIADPFDIDGDGVPDYRDLDTDNDGRSDVVEVGSGCDDSGPNQVCDEPDTDGDGIVDSIDDFDGFGDSSPTVPTDSDGDGDYDFREIDSNGDGTPDLVPGRCPDVNPADDRCDGPDSDGDGIVDSIDDFDGFGTIADTDGDGIADATDLDDDNDGIVDTDEGDGAVDTDGDGIPDSLDLDSDNDGILDSTEAGHGLGNGNGTVTCPAGVGNNGLCDDLETSPDSGTPDYDGDGNADQPVDSDGDGVEDFRDLDSDNDSISDLAEGASGCDDTDANGVCDGGDADADGVVDSRDGTTGFGAGGSNVPPDTDDDGAPDYLDIDSDNDGIHDIVEAGDGAADTDGDGAADGADTDGDGILDAVDGTGDFGGAGPGTDTDGDGTGDHLEQDSDDDGVSDTEEAGDEPNSPVDTDDDGTPDFQDTDSDDDEVTDDTDNCRIVVNPDQVDQDGDGFGAACEDDDNGDQIDDTLGLQGGGCSTGGGSSSAAILLLLLVMFAMRRRSRAVVSAGVVAVLLAVVGAGPAHAQLAALDSEYSVERFRLATDAEGILDVEWASVPAHMAFDLGLWLGYADDPLNLNQTVDGERQRAASLISHRLGGNLVGSLGLYERLQVGLAVPLVLGQGQDVDSLAMGPASPTSFGLGDLRVIPKVAILRQQDFGVHVGLAVAFSLPTSTSSDYFGDSSAAFVPEVLVSRSFANGLRLAGNLGYRMRKKVESIDLVVDDEVFTHVGVGYRFAARGGPPLEVDLTYAAATGASDMLGSFNRNYSEIKPGLVYDIAGPLVTFLAGGVGLSEGFATPDWRVLAGVRFSKTKSAEPVQESLLTVSVVADTDGDGILDDVDECPAEPETFNSFEDTDGCPDPITETVPDTDGDGINDKFDECPEVAEDKDSFEDEDGCEDPDNDADSVLDVDDACPMVPGVVALAGCPDPDRDGDTVVDRLDNCPDEAGSVEFQGCLKRQLVALTGGTIEVLDIVHFKTNKDVILSISFGLLDNVAEVIRDHSEIDKIRVEGHTDERGRDAYNKDLSQRRAESVVRYLVSKGVAVERLEAVGFGEEVPVATNATKEGRAANRRVEFKIIGSANSQIDIKKSGPTEHTIDN